MYFRLYIYTILMMGFLKREGSNLGFRESPAYIYNPRPKIQSLKIESWNTKSQTFSLFHHWKMACSFPMYYYFKNLYLNTKCWGKKSVEHEWHHPWMSPPHTSGQSSRWHVACFDMSGPQPVMGLSGPTGKSHVFLSMALAARTWYVYFLKLHKPFRIVHCAPRTLTS